MSRQPRKINRAAAERLLRGEPTQPHDRLAVLLATAAAPGQDGLGRGGPGMEGEEAAVAAFRAARSAGALSHGRAVGRTRPGAQSRDRARWARHPVQLAVFAVTATTAGGIALAAGTVDRSPSHTQDSAAATPSQNASAAAGKSRGQLRSPVGTPEPSTTGLCRAYRAGAGSAQGKALDNPAFASLIKAAGGKDKVAGYCASVLAPKAGKDKRQPSRPPSARPTHANQPPTHPPTQPPTQPPEKVNPHATKGNTANPQSSRP